jgi:pteridine reductase
MIKKISNKTALITGGAKRIGAGIAIKLAKMGYDLVITYNHSKKEAKDLQNLIISKYLVKCQIIKCDLFKIKEVEKLARYLEKNLDNCSLLVNNASIFNQSKFISSNSKDLTANLQIHLLSPLILSHYFAKNVVINQIKDANIINMVDKNIKRFETKYFNYLLSKKFLAQTTEMLALELAPQIRVNAIAPGFILKSIDNNYKPSSIPEIISKIPLKSKGNVENITQTVEFLITNKFITGQIIFIDGGASLNHAG